MGFIIGIWSGLLQGWIHLGTGIFPPVIHPMMVHFPIVLLYGTLLTTILGYLWPMPDRFFDRASFWLLVLALIAGIWTAATGVLSESFVKWTPTTLALLTRHQTFAVLTGVLVILALVSRLMARYPRNARNHRAWSLNGSGRGKPSGLSFVFLVAAIAMITMTASIGGTMVYQYGVGVHGVSFHEPSWLRHKGG